MKKTLMFIMILSVILIVSGCAKTQDIPEGDKITTEKDGDTVTTTVETDEGKQTTTVTGSAVSDDWCPEGGNWEMTSTGVEGESSATWKIDKRETSGEYAGMCHVIYTATGPTGDVTMDYWFEEGGKNGYLEMELNGQKIKQEWHE